MEIPQVIFFGQLMTLEGPIHGPCKMTPQLDVFEFEDTLITTCEYEFDLDKDGKFKVEVFPTDIGCDDPWEYYFITPVNAFSVALPLKSAPHNFKKMLEKSKKRK